MGVSESLLVPTTLQGFRLAVLAGRLGFPPYALAPAEGAVDAFSGFPLAVPGRAPRSIDGVPHPVAFELNRGAGRLAFLGQATDGRAVLLAGPLPMERVAAVHFVDDETRISTLASLEVLEIDAPSSLQVATSPHLFSDPEQLPSIIVDGVRAAGRRWATHLDLQERVSAALILCEAVGGEDEDGACIAALRYPPEPRDLDSTCGDLRRAAGGFARIDHLGGWTPEDLVAAMQRGQLGSALADFAAEAADADDAFSDAVGRPARTDAEKAVVFLLRHRGAAGREIALAATNAKADEPLTPLGAALAGISVGRTLLPPSLCGGARAFALAGDEIEAARLAIEGVHHVDPAIPPIPDAT